MNQNTVSRHAVALLATGDEISNGDVLNSNSQEIAQRLVKQGIATGMHLVTGDCIDDIRSAIQFLLQSHGALIITGGLGPTSDDLTRYALAKALGRELVFDTKIWNSIVERLTSLGYVPVPQTNRQQALFPEGATIIPNQKGSAAGCMFQKTNQTIFMLPGPPLECLPMVDAFVLPNLESNGFVKISHHRRWLLFGVSEGEIAEKLDELCKPYQCTTGYRLAYPYIEFKLYSDTDCDFTTLVPQIEKAIAPYLIGDGSLTAAELLKQKILFLKVPLTIIDNATGGMLESIIKTPRTYPHLNFSKHLKKPPGGLYVHINGLEEFWEGKKTLHSSVEIIFEYPQGEKHFKNTIPFRGTRVKQYAVEFICKQIYDFVNNLQQYFF